jgi:hypothetical protein
VGLYSDLCRTGIVNSVYRQTWTADVRQRQEIILNSTVSRPSIGPNQSPIQRIMVAFSVNVNREADRLLSSSSEPTWRSAFIDLPYREMAVT